MEKRFDVAFGIGYEYAEKINYLPYLMETGFYNVVQLVIDESSQLNLKSNGSIEILNKDFDGAKEKLTNFELEKKSFGDQLVLIKDEKERKDKEFFDRIKKFEDAIASGETEIEELVSGTNDLDIAGRKKSVLSKVILYIIFLGLTISLIVFYSSAWYSVIFEDIGSDSNNIGKEYGLISTIINPFYIAQVVNENNNYIGLLYSFSLTCLPFAVGLIFHSALVKKTSKSITIAALSILLALALDVVIAYSIVKKIFEYRQGLGLNPDVDFSFVMCFSDVIFYIILLIGFVTYLLWGVVYEMMLHHTNDITSRKGRISAIRDIIKKHQNKKKEIINTLNSEEVVFQNKIRDFNGRFIVIEEEISHLKSLMVEIQKKISEYPDKIFIHRYDLEHVVDAFIAGWCSSYTDSLGKKHQKNVDTYLVNVDEKKNQIINKILDDKRYEVI
jgi:hypothetical protein